MDRSRYFAQLFSLDPEGGPDIVYARPDTVVPGKMLVREQNAVIEKLLSPLEPIQVGNAKPFDRFAIDLSKIRVADAPVLLRVLTEMLRDGGNADFERLRAAKADLEVSILVTRLEKRLRATGCESRNGSNPNVAAGGFPWNSAGLLFRPGKADPAASGVWKSPALRRRRFPAGRDAGPGKSAGFAIH